MPHRNNYASDIVEILYRMFVSHNLVYAHNYSAQSVDNSEQKSGVLCTDDVTFRIGFSCFRLQKYDNQTKSFCVVTKNCHQLAEFC